MMFASGVNHPVLHVLPPTITSKVCKHRDSSVYTLWIFSRYSLLFIYFGFVAKSNPLSIYCKLEMNFLNKPTSLSLFGSTGSSSHTFPCSWLQKALANGDVTSSFWWKAATAAWNQYWSCAKEDALCSRKHLIIFNLFVYPYMFDLGKRMF